MSGYILDIIYVIHYYIYYIMIIGKETKKAWLSAELVSRMRTQEMVVLTINKLKDNH